MKYQAFISYKHGGTTLFAQALEAALKSYAKPLLRIPPKIFRDERHLVPGHDLPALLAQALTESEHLILLASPEAAASRWVADEVDLWCGTLQRTGNLVIVLTEGEIVERERQVDWARTSALPPNLSRYLQRIPLYVDVRECRKPEDLSLRHPAFLRAVNAISAKLRGLDPNDLAGDEVRIHRRNIALRNAAIGLLALFAIAAASAAAVAVMQRQEAEAQRRFAVSRMLATQAELSRGDTAQSVELSAILAAEGLRRAPTAEGDEALRRSLARIRRPALWRHKLETVAEFSFDRDGSTLAILSGGQVRIFETRTGREAAGLDAKDVDRVLVGPQGRYLAATKRADDKTVVAVYAIQDDLREMMAVPADGDLRFASDDRLVIVSEADSPSGRSGVEVWDLKQRRRSFRLERSGPVRLLGFVADQDAFLLLERPRLNTSLIRAVRGADGATLFEHAIDAAVLLAAFDEQAAIALTQTVMGPGAGGRREQIRLLDIIWAQEPRESRIVDRATLSNGADVTDLSFTPDGTRLVSTGADKTVRLWQLETPVHKLPSPIASMLVATPDGRRRSGRFAQVVATSPAGDIVAAADPFQGAYVYQVASGRKVWLLLGAGTGSVSGMQFAPEGRLIVIERDGTLSAWSTDPGPEVFRLAGEGSLGAAFSPDGTMLAVSGKGGSRLWRAGSHDIWKTLPDEATAISARFSAGGAFVTVSAPTITSSRTIGDRDIRLWSLADGNIVARRRRDDGRSEFRSALSPDGSLLAVLNRDNSVEISKAVSAHGVEKLMPREPAVAIGFDPTGTCLAILSQSTIEVVTLGAGAPLSRSAHQHTVKLDRNYAGIGAISRGCRQVVVRTGLVTLGDDYLVWDVGQAREIAGERASAAAFSQDGKWLAIGRSGGTIDIVSTASGARVGQLAHVGAPRALAFSPDSGFIAAGSDRYLRIFDVALVREVARIEHPGTVWHALFAQQGPYIATSTGEEVRVLLWRPADMIAEAGARVTRNLSLPEWRQFFPDEEYRKTFDGLPGPRGSD